LSQVLSIPNYSLTQGGSSGIGKGTVEYFSSLGAKVVSADVNPSPSLPEGATFQQCNVKVWSEIVNLFRETRKLHGSIDVVCANAGIADREDLLGDNEEEPAWDVLDVNLKGVMMSMSH
jgi:NAD(P)-dependent dehydrogenase (short-subunit alcohol dehydrogenase family)